MITVVLPVYKNEESLPEVVEQLEGLCRRLPVGLEAVFVVDGSPDRSFAYLAERLPSACFPSQLLLLSRNFGSFRAITAGMEAGRGEHFAVLAADLQEPPELVEDFHRMLASGEVDIVFGQRESRDDPTSSRIFSDVFWWLFRKLIFRDIPPGGVDVFACNKRVRDQILTLREQETTLIGLLFWIGYRRGFAPYRRLARKHGRSAWGFSRKLDYFLDSFFSFTNLPIKLMTIIGLIGMATSVLLGCIVLIARLSGNISVPGYTASVLTIVFFGGLNSLGLGVIGEYVWRIFRNTQNRPTYIVRERSVFEPSALNERSAAHDRRVETGDGTGRRAFIGS